jgi:hypothetical protein
MSSTRWEHAIIEGLSSEREDPPSQAFHIGDQFFETDTGDHYVIGIDPLTGDVTWLHDSDQIPPVANEDYIVYLDAVNGNDKNDGFDPKKPIKTIGRLFDLEVTHWRQRRINYFAPGVYPWPTYPEATDYRVGQAFNHAPGKPQVAGEEDWIGGLSPIPGIPTMTVASDVFFDNHIPINQSIPDHALRGAIIQLGGASNPSSIGGSQIRVIDNVAGVILTVGFIVPPDPNAPPVPITSGTQLTALRPNVTIKNASFKGNPTDMSPLVLSQINFENNFSAASLNMLLDRVSFDTKNSPIFFTRFCFVEVGGSVVVPTPNSNDAVYVKSDAFEGVGGSINVIQHSVWSGGIVLYNTIFFTSQESTINAQPYFGTNSPVQALNSLECNIGSGFAAQGFIDDIQPNFGWNLENFNVSGAGAAFDTNGVRRASVGFLEISRNAVNGMNAYQYTTFTTFFPNGDNNVGYGQTVGLGSRIYNFGIELTGGIEGTLGEVLLGADAFFGDNGAVYTYLGVQAAPGAVFPNVPPVSGAVVGGAIMDTLGNVIFVDPEL